MNVFVYGTLTERARAESVLPEFEYEGGAVLDGLHRVDGTYPTLAPGGQAQGRILRTPDVAALDAYEGVDRGLYVRVSLPTDGGDRIAVYVGDPDHLGVGDDVRWPGSGPFEDRVRRDVEERDVAVRRGHPDDGSFGPPGV